MRPEKTIYESAIERGVSRRDFLKVCTALAATLGLDYSQSGKVVQAMETNKRIPVIWLQLMDCTGCSESFIRSSHPRTENVLFDMISLEYHELLSAAAGHQIEENRERIMEQYKGEYILVVEGNVTDDEFLTVAGHSALESLKETAKHAKAVLAYGSCSAFGGLAAAKPNPTNAKAVSDVVRGVPIINVPGCPPIAEVMTGVIAHVITFGRLPELDRQGRPKAFYKLRIHDKCNRRAYFDAGLFVESFDDEGAKVGYCLYKVGCAGPTTYNACAEMRWNGGVSYPIQSGNPCIGCSEKNFWDEGPFFTRRAKIPGTQTTINPEKVGLYATGATAAGIAGHAALTAMKKKKDEKANSEKNSSQEG
ncbi:[NiFe] hydrogenase small subunit HydA [Anaerobacillus arseniciselenatis]|uniref:[NiFe] hydrogenase small subunit HydA n=1 Tax=Anaerobacillus arseniciselenatis TaxID=85682 RepID=A0A1S2LTE1_9BACI|nr:hydrogenase small subunit [Anaerobacillus arseniciselenatis]OIJ15782.1 [NiFe] hydrogenase small subunit HydA [Anaerobacillus arseniciselenatis]